MANLEWQQKAQKMQQEVERKFYEKVANYTSGQRLLLPDKLKQQALLDKKKEEDVDYTEVGYLLYYLLAGVTNHFTCCVSYLDLCYLVVGGTYHFTFVVFHSST